MTPQQKANELVDKFFNADQGSEISNGWVDMKTAVRCAIIHCEEKIGEFEEMNNNVAGLQFTTRIEYWQQVLSILKH